MFVQYYRHNKRYRRRSWYNARCSGNIPSTQDVVHIAMSMIKIYKGKSTRSYLHFDFTDVVTILTIYYIISHVIYRIFNVFFPL